jgi:hypothetical protein
MNERIKSLLVECVAELVKGTHNGQTGTAVDLPVGQMFDFEKFAELIVKECADRIRKEIEFGNSELSTSNAYKLAFMTHAADLIEQHFGIEKPTVDSQLRNRSTYFGNNP